MKKLAIWIFGGPEWKRYLIVKEGGRFWDGMRWTRHRKRARLYADNQDVAFVFRDLEAAQFSGKPLRMFEATLNIRVQADQHFDSALLSEYLQAAVQIIIDQERCGSGPVPDSLVQLDVT